MNSLRASKKVLRERVMQALAGLSREAVERQSCDAVKALLNMHQYQEARRISVYLSIQGKEVETDRIVEDALGSGKQVFVPYIHKVTTMDGESESVMDMLALKSTSDFLSFERDRWGIPSIPDGTIDARENCFGGHGLSGRSLEDGKRLPGLDLIVVPGVAFDRDLRRLGHGKGYYDKFLDRCKERVDAREMKTMPLLVALALDEQMLPSNEEVPVASYDWRMDRLVNCNEIL